MILQPLRGKILVEVLSDNKRTESGLYLAGIKNEVPHRGKVISMGAPFIDRKGRSHAWGFQENHIVHYKKNWDGGKEKYQILSRVMIYAVEYQDKPYGIGEYIIVKKLEDEAIGKIIVPSHFESEVSKQTGFAEVVSVGREDKLGVSVGDRLLYYRNEGLSVRIPLQEELWSLKSRAVCAVIN